MVDPEQDPEQRAAGMRMSGDTEAVQQSRKHIFCVNGSAVLLGLLTELFSEESYNVTTTNYLPQTFDQIGLLQPDLVVVDLVFGVQAGWRLLEQLVRDAKTRELTVLVTSTNQRILDEVHADPTRFGLHQQLVKPFDISTILGIVNELIGPA